jgi:nucleoside 2-deoxyribosyltransferase
MSLTTSLTVADLVFALLDHLDSGTHFELGYARKEETPVIGYADNLETSSETMILGSGSEVYDDLSRAGPLSPVFSESRG